MRTAVLLASLALLATCDDDGRDDPEGSAAPPTVQTPGTLAEPDGDGSLAPGVADTAPAGSTQPDGVLPTGFTTVTVRITDADGSVCEVCMWLADDGDERGRGLMGVTDLGRAAGMAFVFPGPAEGAFYMYRTPTPLSIAWFAPDGAFVSATDMEPCTSVALDCPRYRAGGPYELAIEVFAGGLAELGIGPGSSAELVTGTESPACPATPG